MAAATAVAVVLATGGTGAAAAPAPGVPRAAQAQAQAQAQQTAQAQPGPVVALGDSYTAGDILPLSLTSQPIGCLRSPKSYPFLVAKALGAGGDFIDAACGGAGVKEMTRAQQTYLGTNPAQLSALAPGDRLVMLTLGGDDLGFLNVLDECMALSITDPFGSPCESHYTSGGTDQLAARVAAETAKMTAVLAAVRTRAPDARVLVVGYPDLFPQQGGCWPAVPITDGDITYLRGIETQLNGMLAQIASAAGDTFVDTYTPTTGHDFCQDAHVRDVEGLLSGSLTAPFHPNTRGQAAMAGAVLAALGVRSGA